MQVTKSGIYRFRVRVPKDAVRFFKKFELNRSLKTKSLHSAQIKALMLYNRFQEILEIIRGNMLTDEQIQELVDYYVYIAMKVEDDIHIARQVPYSMKDFDVYLHEEQVKRSEEKLFEADLDEVAESAKMLLNILDIELDTSDAQHKRFMLKLLQAETYINKLTLDRKHGNWVDVPKPIVAEEKINTPNSNFTMQEAVDLYIKGLDPKKVEEKKAKSSFLNGVFLELIGRDTNAASVDIEHLLKIRELLSLFPRRNIHKYSKMSIADIILLVKGDKDIPVEDVISTRSLNKFISWFTAVFVNAENYGKIPRNLAKNLKLKIDTAEDEEREPFSPEELKQISELLPEDLRRTIVNILYFTGMRLSEVFKAKLNQVNGIYIFDLTAKKDDVGSPIKLKTKNAYRVIPLHQKLIDMDIPSIFHELQSQYSSSYMSSWFNSKLLRPYVTKEKTKVLYSLRHNFATGLKNKQIQESIVAELMGHEQSTLSYKRYAGDYDIAILKEAVDKLDFELL
jgi:integrase